VLLVMSNMMTLNMLTEMKSQSSNRRICDVLLLTNVEVERSVELLEVVYDSHMEYDNMTLIISEAFNFGIDDNSHPKVRGRWMAI